MLEVGEAEAEWARKEEKRKKEEERRAAIHQDRWAEVKGKPSYQRNADRLVADLARRDTAAAMRTYADEIAAHAARLDSSDARAARERADRIRQHAERTDSLNGPLRLEKVTSCSQEVLQPHMNGWSTRGPYRR